MQWTNAIKTEIGYMRHCHGEELDFCEFFEAETAEVGASVATAMAQLLRDSSIQHRLKEFAVMIIRRSRAPAEVVVYACGLVNRINYQVRGSLNSHNIKRYFFSALMVSYDLVCQESPTLESWVIISKNKFTVQQILLFQQAFLSIISWNLLIERATFVFAVKHLMNSLARVRNPATEAVSRVAGTIMNSRFASACQSADISDCSSDTEASS